MLALHELRMKRTMVLVPESHTPTRVIQVNQFLYHIIPHTTTAETSATGNVAQNHQTRPKKSEKGPQP